jgi:Protein of unknown function (DUF642)
MPPQSRELTLRDFPGRQLKKNRSDYFFNHRIVQLMFNVNGGTMMRLMLALALSSCAAFGAGFTNGSFELNNNCDAPAGGWRLLGAGSTCITGWVVAAGSVDYSNGLWMASNGIHSVELNGEAVGGISQTFDTLPNHTYRRCENHDGQRRGNFTGVLL